MKRLLAPRSIAVFGGSWAYAVIRQTQKMGYTGEIWPVHPTKSVIEGLPAYRSVADLPSAPDAAFIGVNRAATIPIVRALAALGAGGAVCFAAGFEEAALEDSDGVRLQSELVEAAGSMPILGPNCYGLINYCDGVALWPDQHGGLRLTEGQRGVAIVTQSSNIAINLTMQRRGLPIAFVVTAGNQAQLGLSDIALGLIEDPRVSVLGLHIEGFDSVQGFETLARRARALRKPIVAIKVGKSEQARAGTISHTASLAGSDAASGAFLKRLGIARLSSIQSFLEALKLLHVTGPLTGHRLSSMSCSGGEASLMADSAMGHLCEFPPLGEASKKALEKALGPMVALANPLDYNTFVWNDAAAMRQVFSAMVSGDHDLNILMLDFPRADRCSDADWATAVNAFEAALKMHGAKGAIVASMPENLSEAHAADLMRRGIAPLLGIDEALDAADAALAVGGAWEKEVQPPVLRAVSSSSIPLLLTEAEAKARLSAFGLPVPVGRVVCSVEEALQAAAELGFPVAAKALGIAHKSEAGAVRLGLADAEAVRRAAGDLLTVLSHSLLIERMIQRPAAELIVGVTHDPVFGPVMTIGTGGVTAELLQDTITLLLPASETDISAALQSLKLHPLLTGYRGRAKADIEAAINVIQGIARFAEANAATLEEMDVNPLIICENGHGAGIADALIVERRP
jgi:acetate---CoA ligase (ADP-forming)